jgi:hypothetical protein
MRARLQTELRTSSKAEAVASSEEARHDFVAVSVIPEAVCKRHGIDHLRDPATA